MHLTMRAPIHLRQKTVPTRVKDYESFTEKVKFGYFSHLKRTIPPASQQFYHASELINIWNQLAPLF